MRALTVECKIWFSKREKEQLETTRREAKWFYNYMLTMYRYYVNTERKNYDGWEHFKRNVLWKTSVLKTVPVKVVKAIEIRELTSLPSLERRNIVDRFEASIKSWISNLKA